MNTKNIKKEYLFNFEYSKPNLFFGGLLGFFGFPLYYFVWHDLFPQQYENLYLRLICALLFFPLIIYNYLPAKIKNLFPYYFFFTIFTNLPLFFGFMIIKNDFSSVWVMSFLTTAYLMIFLIYNWALILLMILAGIVLSFVIVFFSEGALSIAKFDLQYVPIVLFAILSGLVCNYRTAISGKSKLNNMQAFGGSVAHEMRNPLNAINLLLMEAEQIFKKQKTGTTNIKSNDIDQINHIFATITNCTKRTNNVIDIILANIRDEKPSIINEPLLASELIKKAIQEYGYNDAKEREKVILKIDDDFVFMGEKTTFIYALFNLLKNALYYLSSHPESIITITTTKQDKKYRKLIVKDTGPGIAKERIKSLFKTFNTSGKDGGTGLGLDFVYKAMQRFGGSVECNSVLGEFTEFILNFPICNQKPKLKKTIKNDVAKIIFNKSILIVDDEEFNRRFIKMMLGFIGKDLTIIEAKNGEEALSILANQDEENAIDIILTDIKMPIIDGYKLSQTLRTNPKFNQYQKVAIIAFTGDNDPETLNKIYKSGMSGHIVKGASRGEIIGVISKIINNID